ncbi:MAG: sel1 repeat family protein [Legionellales bacterium]|nr:sel1 repeat family protein [Legionellales bacterium]
MLDEMMERVKKGHYEAMYEIAEYYYSEDDTDIGDVWLVRAAKHGVPKALEHVGKYHEQGVRNFKHDANLAHRYFEAANFFYVEYWGCSNDCTYSRDLMKKYYNNDGFSVEELQTKAENGCCDSQFAYGLYLASGYGVDDTNDINRKEAGELLIKAARNGCKYAQWHLGDIWDSIYCLSRSNDDAEYVAQRCWCASFKLGWCFYLGIGVKQNLVKARELWLLALKQLGEVGTRYTDSCYSEEARKKYLDIVLSNITVFEDEQAASEIRNIFKDGIGFSCCCIGDGCGNFGYHNSGVMRLVGEKARALKQARNGDFNAMCQIYLISKKIQEKPMFSDYDVGLNWLKQAVANNNPKAQYHMARVCYPDDKKQAYKLLVSSAKQSYIPSLYILELYFGHSKSSYKPMDFTIDINKKVKHGHK